VIALVILWTGFPAAFAAMYPYLLPPDLTVQAAAAPAGTEAAELIVVGLIVVLVGPRSRAGSSN
jgi:cytochrome bd-type quinol oxidase subunit 2